jgi:general stress protein 26
MTPVEDEFRNGEVSRHLTAAENLIRSAPDCWLITLSGAGGANARPMGRVLPTSHRNNWKILFLTDGRSRKVSDIRRASAVKLTFRHDSDQAFAALDGLATLINESSDVTRLWKKGYDVHFATVTDRANAAFIEVAVDRMELWIRGVTPEPFGLHPTIVERAAEGGWRLRASPTL